MWRVYVNEGTKLAYNYSKIDNIYIKDFNNIETLILDFKESPIITLVGDNEAGKTSMIEAFGVCALHKDPRSQADHIRDNTSMFGVAITLEDGTNIIRMKHANGNNTYRVIKDNKVIWESNKITDGLPEVVQQAMGMMVESETKEYLQIRSYGSKLMFVTTAASANYKVMYNSLKVENLTRAIKAGNTEVNKLKQQVGSASIAYDTLDIQLRGLRVVDLTDVVPLRDALIHGKKIVSSIERCMQLKSDINRMNNTMGLIKLISDYNLTEINRVLASKLSDANRSITKLKEVESKLKSISEIDQLTEIDSSLVIKLGNVIDKIKEVETLESSNEAYLDLAGLQPVSATTLAKLRKCVDKLDELHQNERDLERFNLSGANEIESDSLEVIDRLENAKALIVKVRNMQAELETCNAESDRITNILTECGVAFETCSKCGAPVIIDLDKIKGAV